LKEFCERLKRGPNESQNVSSNFSILTTLNKYQNETIFINGRNSYLKLKDALFKEYKIDFKKRKLSPIILKGKVDKKGLTIYSALKR